MNDNELMSRTRRAADKLLYEKKYIAPVDLFMEINALSKKDYELWRQGKVAFLERIIGMNLSKTNKVMKVLKKYANEKHLKPSYTAYMRWGKGPKQKLKFSKSGRESLEKEYSMHYVAQ